MRYNLGRVKSENHLVIKVQTTTTTTMQNLSDQVEDPLEQFSLEEVDDCCLFTESSSSGSISVGAANPLMTEENPVEGEFQLIYGDVYECPAVYIRLWEKTTGRLLSEHNANQLMQRLVQTLHNQQTSAEESSTQKAESPQVIDHRIYRHGDLLLDMHPHNGALYLAFHLCEMSDLFKSIITISAEDQPSNFGKLLILQFLHFIGRHIAIDISSDNYRTLIEMFSL